MRLELDITVTPQRFGAVADGVVDDTAAMQAAHDTGEQVYYPPGVYKFSTITMASGGIVGAGTSLVASGAAGATVLKSTSGDDANLITWAGNEISANYPIFRDFAVVLADGQKPAGAGIFINPASGASSPLHFAHMSNLVFRFVPNCVRMVETSDYMIRDSQFQYYTGRAVEHSRNGNPDAGDSSISGCAFFNGIGAFGEVGTAIYYTNGGGLRVLNNKFNGGAVGIHSDVKHTTSVFLANGNSLENISKAAILFTNSANLNTNPVRFANVSITGNEFAGNLRDVFFAEITEYPGASYWDNIAVAGNTFSPWAEDAVSVELRSARYFAISGNVINGNGCGATGVKVAPSCTHGRLTGNVFANLGVDVDATFGSILV